MTIPSNSTASGVLRTAEHLKRKAQLDDNINSVIPDAKRQRSLAPSLYLGFDLSTQSCKAVAINRKLEVVYSSRVGFDEDLPQYGTINGVIRGEGGRVTSSPKMWIEALELALERLKSAGCPMQQICAISGSGQQHGSVYWVEGACALLKSLDPSKGSLVSQLKDAFATDSSPIWMDTSCKEGCDAMEQSVGGPLNLSRMTGSRAYERFSGHLIKQFIEDHGISACGRISLVSSFGASLLVGDIAGIDTCDGAGMNLMDIESLTWSRELLEYVADGDADTLEGKLGQIQEPWTVAGFISRYFCAKFGFSGEAKIVHWSGDNPCSVVGLGMLQPGDLAISLGTSDTCMAVVGDVPEPLAFGHVFPHPLLKDKYWVMLCYSNGDVTRRQVRDDFANGNWDVFDKCLTEGTSPGNDGYLGLFFTTDEITPKMPKRPTLRLKKGMEIDTFQSPQQNCRAVIEQRAIAIRTHLQQVSPELLTLKPGAKLLLTGGASANPAIRQIYADVFGREVCCLELPDSAAVGAAYRALHAVDSPECLGEQIASKAVSREKPRTELTTGIYAELTREYDQLEASLGNSLLGGWGITPYQQSLFDAGYL